MPLADAPGGIHEATKIARLKHRLKNMHLGTVVAANTSINTITEGDSASGASASATAGGSTGLPPDAGPGASARAWPRPKLPAVCAARQPRAREKTRSKQTTAAGETRQESGQARRDRQQT